MELIYDIHDKPSFSKIIAFAFQQLLAIAAGTIALPLIVGHGMSQSAALFGAAIGTIVYLIITKFKSPVFLGSSFTYLGSMIATFTGAATFGFAEIVGFLGIVIGAVLAGLVYVVLSIVVKFVGTNWINKIMPPVVIGPIVALIGLTLAPNAITNITCGNVYVAGEMVANKYLCLGIGLITLFVTVIISTQAKGFIKLIPFIIAIAAGYLVAAIFTIIGNVHDINAFKIIDFSAFKNMKWYPDFTFFHFKDGFDEIRGKSGSFLQYCIFIFCLYVPIALAVFAEHIADHKNLSTIIGHDLILEPGLRRTLLGDGLGSMVGAIFGGCPNTTYGESISCVAYSRNASIITIVVSCILAVSISFIAPIMTFFQTIPTCIVGGLSIALYGFIASSGLRMLKDVDLGDIKNIFVISAIFVVGIGGLVISISFIAIPTIACALLLGIITNLLVNIKHRKKEKL